MKLKRATFLLLTSVITFSSFHCIFAEENENISSGLYSSDTFQSDYTLDEKDGKYVNFYIENVGDIAVSATINGEEKRIFQPNEKGHIYIEVDNSIFGKSKEYTFRAVSEPVGATIKINYIIAQRDSQ